MFSGCGPCAGTQSGYTKTCDTEIRGLWRVSANESVSIVVGRDSIICVFLPRGRLISRAAQLFVFVILLLFRDRCRIAIEIIARFDCFAGAVGLRFAFDAMEPFRIGIQFGINKLFKCLDLPLRHGLRKVFGCALFSHLRIFSFICSSFRSAAVFDS